MTITVCSMMITLGTASCGKDDAIAGLTETRSPMKEPADSLSEMFREDRGHRTI